MKTSHSNITDVMKQGKFYQYLGPTMRGSYQIGRIYRCMGNLKYMVCMTDKNRGLMQPTLGDEHLFPYPCNKTKHWVETLAKHWKDTN